MSDGAQPEWFATLDDEGKGFIQNRGLDKKTAPEAAMELLKSYREASAKLGIPADQVIRLPKDATNPEEWRPVWRRLGVPEKPEEYDFAAVKQADGSPIDPTYAAWLGTTALSLNIPKDAAAGLASALVKRAEEVRAADQTTSAATIAARHSELQQNWGPNYPTNKFVADRTMALLGYTPQEIAELERHPDYAARMEIMRQRGVALGEAQLIGNGQDGGVTPRVMTREGAIARMEELKKDKIWYARYQAGEKAAVDEWKGLIALQVRRA